MRVGQVLSCGHGLLDFSVHSLLSYLDICTSRKRSRTTTKDSPASLWRFYTNKNHKETRNNVSRNTQQDCKVCERDWTPSQATSVKRHVSAVTSPGTTTDCKVSWEGCNRGCLGMDDFVGGKYRGFPEEIGLQSKFCLTLKNKIYEKKTQQRSTIGKKIWLSIRSRNLGSDLQSRDQSEPQAYQCKIHACNSINMYGNPNATRDVLPANRRATRVL